MIKAGQILTDVNGHVIDRLQSVGPGALNIPEEKIYEVGNFNTVGIVRDIPDLSWDAESFDVSTEFEAMLLNDTTGSLTEFDFLDAIPIDVISPFKLRKGDYSIYKGVITPYLSLERVTYRFGVGESATQSFGLRGDSIYYTPGIPFSESFAYDGTDSDSFTFTFPGASGATAADEYTDNGQAVYALCVTLISSTTGIYKRLYHGDDYTDSPTGFSIITANPEYDTVRVAYSGNGTKEYPQVVHASASTVPAAVRGKDIDLYVGTPGATVGSTYTRFRGVQNVEVTRSVTLENISELGNHHYVSQEYDVADVTGSLTVTPYDATQLWDQLSRITGVDSNKVIGPALTVPVPLEIRINDPDGQAGVLKTLYVPDARFQVPGFQPRANSRLDMTFNFTSEAGTVLVYEGARP